MKLHPWLPSTQAMSNAVQLRPDPFQDTTMRQAMGMICLTGLLAGLLPFLLNWISAGRLGTAVPIAQAVWAAAQLAESAARFGPGLAVLPIDLRGGAEITATLAGLGQPLPGWLAAGASALGLWLSLPLSWLQTWLVYGTLVMAVAKLLGSQVTLQHFFGATGFFAVPLTLVGLSVIPYAGGLIVWLATGWALIVYVKAVQQITALSLIRAVASVALPAAVGAVLLVGGLVFLTLLSLTFLL